MCCCLCLCRSDIDDEQPYFNFCSKKTVTYNERPGHQRSHPCSCSVLVNQNLYVTAWAYFIIVLYTGYIALQHKSESAVPVPSESEEPQFDEISGAPLNEPARRLRGGGGGGGGEDGAAVGHAPDTAAHCILRDASETRARRFAANMSAVVTAAMYMSVLGAASPSDCISCSAVGQKSGGYVRQVCFGEKPVASYAGSTEQLQWVGFWGFCFLLGGLYTLVVGATAMEAEVRHRAKLTGAYVMAVVVCVCAAFSSLIRMFSLRLQFSCTGTPSTAHPFEKSEFVCTHRHVLLPSDNSDDTGCNKDASHCNANCENSCAAFMDAPTKLMLTNLVLGAVFFCLTALRCWHPRFAGKSHVPSAHAEANRAAARADTKKLAWRTVVAGTATAVVVTWHVFYCHGSPKSGTSLLAQCI